jgi:adenylyltransferase/sulfurtransferase
MANLSPSELQRYSRHLILPEFGIGGQEKLKFSSVLVIGAGGLSSPVLLYLAAAGVGQIGIVESDLVDATNLQRQILYNDKETGQPKGALAAQKLEALNPAIKTTWHDTFLNSNNALEIIRPYDIVIDGSDNFPTRYLVNDACVLLDKPLIYGAIFRFEGQVSVFNALTDDGKRGPNYRDLYPSPPPPGMVPSCAEGGVLGVLPGIIGSMQANEAIKVLTGIGEPLTGRMFIIDTATFETRTLKFKARNDYKIHQLIDYDQFCNSASNKPELPHITPKAFNDIPESDRSKYALVDVREPFEHDISDIGGIKIPLDQLEKRLSELPKENTLVLYCRSGKRSANAQQILHDKGFKNTLNLIGGINRWASEVDPSIKTY